MKFYMAYVSPEHSTYIGAFGELDVEKVKKWRENWAGDERFLFVEADSNGDLIPYADFIEKYQ